MKFYPASTDGAMVSAFLSATSGPGSSTGNPAIDWQPIQGRVETLLVTSCYRNRDKLWSEGPLGSYADFTYHNTLEKFENAALFLWLDLPSSLTRHENGAFQKRFSKTLLKPERFDF